MMDSNKCVSVLINKYGDQVLPIYNLPQYYCPGGIENIKAILLGCDPSNKHCHHLPYVFALESGLPIFNKLISDLETNLNQIGLNWHTIYVQNLCQNYFRNETSSNLKIWKESTDFWIPQLKEELSVFPSKIPVLMTSAYLYGVLKIGKKYNPQEYYSNDSKNMLPIPAEESRLNRPLIPFYRNRRKIDYHLSNPNWNDYKKKIIKYLRE